jgi:hypothetical protein
MLTSWVIYDEHAAGSYISLISTYEKVQPEQTRWCRVEGRRCTVLHVQTGNSRCINQFTMTPFRLFRQLKISGNYLHVHNFLKDQNIAPEVLNV